MRLGVEIRFARISSGQRKFDTLGPVHGDGGSAIFASLLVENNRLIVKELVSHILILSLVEFVLITC